MVRCRGGEDGWRFLSVPLAGYMRVADAAVALGVTTRRVRLLIVRGSLREERLSPRLYLVERETVNRYARTRRPAGRPAGTPARMDN